MAGITTEQRKEIFNHVLETVFQYAAGSTLQRAFKERGPTTIDNLITISNDEIETLEYTDTGKTRKTPLMKAYKSEVRIFQLYIQWRQHENRPVETLGDWMNLTSDEYFSFKMGKYRIEMIALNKVNTQPSTTTRTPADDFRKGIKRDPSAFKEFKRDELFEDWRGTTLSIARSQGVDNVLDPKYQPYGIDDEELFKEQQRYMFAVLESTLSTTNGKRVVRKYRETGDAQKAFEELVDEYSKSTRATHSASDIMTYLTSAKLGDGEWKGSAEGFIIHWDEQCRQHDLLCEDADDKIGNGMKKTMLQTAVNLIDDLRQVQNTSEMARTAGMSTKQKYEKYLSVLKSAAITYDKERGSISARAHANRRKAYMAEYTDDPDFGSSEGNGGDFDIDTPAQTLLSAYQGRIKPASNSRMPDDVFKQLSDDERQAWFTLSPTIRAAILGNRPSNNHEGTPAYRRPQQTSNRRRQANLHDVSAADFLTVCSSLRATQEESDTPNDNATSNPDAHDETDPNIEGETLLAYLAEGKLDNLPAGHIAKAMSKVHARKAESVPRKNNPANVKFSVSNTDITYRCSKLRTKTVRQGLCDRGANGIICGTDDVRVISYPIGNPKVSVEAYNEHTDKDIPIVHVGGVIQTHNGPVIGILNWAAMGKQRRTILSAGQMEYHGCDVNDKSIKVKGGLQRIITADNRYVIPINIRNGLPYISIRPYTDSEWENLPHTVLTSDTPWDPSVLDHELTDDEQWYDAIDHLENEPNTQLFDLYGNYMHHENNLAFMDASTFISVNKYDVRRDEDIIDDEYLPIEIDKKATATPVYLPTEEIKKMIKGGPNNIKATPTDYKKFQSRFLFRPVEIIKKTFEHTTQYARLPMGDRLRRAFKSPNPALNVPRRPEPVATDTVFASTPAVDDGSTAAHVFVGTETTVTDVYGAKTGKQFVRALEDNIRSRGAMDKLVSDRGSEEISQRAQDVLRAFVIPTWQSEPHQHHQNPCERRYQDMKRISNILMNTSGCNPFCWLLCLMYVAFIMNRTWNESIQAIPLEKLTGSTQDISIILRFAWYEPVYYQLEEYSYPNESPEGRGRFVGFAENVGHALTYKILTDETNKVICRSSVRSALNGERHNLRLEPLDGEQFQEFIHSRYGELPSPVSEQKEDTSPVSEQEKDTSKATLRGVKKRTLNVEEVLKAADEAGAEEGFVPQPTMPIFNVDDLIGRSFLMDEKDNGEIHRAKIVEMLDKHEGELERQPARVRFKCSVNNDEYEEILTYNELLRHLNRDAENETVWRFKSIVGHTGPIKPGEHNYKGSRYNVLVEWENGETTEEPLAIIGKDDPITCAIYAKVNNLLETPGWKQFAPYARREKKLKRMINQAKLKSFRSAKKFKYGVEIPKDYDDALRLDAENGNTDWADATKKEMDQIDEYEVFKDNGYQRPSGYKQIRVHLVYDCKHDGRRKGRLVADGHLTDVPLESVYSGVVSLRGIRMLTFLAELNKLELWATDIGNAYLEAKTKEKLYIVAGKEFGPDRYKHILIIDRALYGLRTSGVRWHERFADCLKNEGFTPCKAEPDIWMRANGDVYEYIGVYVDDLAFAMKDPKAFAKVLMDKYKFKLKGTGPIEFHLGCDFIRDDDGTLRMEPKKYIERMITSYEKMFGGKPSHKVFSPLPKNDHPELDSSEFLDESNVTKYQSLIGSMQWAISLGRFDISTAVMTLSSFRAQPRKGHLERAKRVVGYLSKFREGAIRFRVDEPDHTDVTMVDYDWSYSVYGNVKEAVPKDAPEPLGRYVTHTCYVDANLMHCLLTGRSVTGILHMLNGTPMDYFAKKQSTVETATFGSEFVAARTAIEQITEMRLTLRYLGVPLRDQTYMFGDNETVVNSATQPHGKLHKRHTMLSFHRVREAIASKMVIFTHLRGEFNPADILSKHWGYDAVWSMLRVLLFFKGDTANSISED